MIPLPDETPEAAERECGHPNHGAADHDCTPFAPSEPDAVQRIVKAWDCCGTCAGGVLATLLADARREGGDERAEKIARGSERLRRENPMNGDGANHMLDQVQRVIGAADAVAEERRIIAAEREAQYARLEAENAARSTR